VPPPTLPVSVQREIAEATERLARRLEVRGLMNVQYAVRGDDVYVLEANPRASRTIPYVSKALDVPLAKLAARVMLGQSIAQLEADGWFRRPPGVGETVPYLSVKEAVLPFLKFPGADALIGPEMRSTGEVMGIDARFGTAYGKSQAAAGVRLPTKGRVFLSLADRDKRRDLLSALRELVDAGFDLVATTGTAEWLRSGGLDVVETLAKVGAASGDDTVEPTAVDLIAQGRLDAVINTPRGRGARADGAYIRSAAVAAGIPVITTVAGAKAAIAAIADDRTGAPSVRSLQEWHALLAEHRR
jgi:carbamoyl-phosphate synthase large subunit